MIVTWPITKERYRQVLLKMHRHWNVIQKYEVTEREFINSLRSRVENLKEYMNELDKSCIYSKDMCQNELNTIKMILQLYRKCKK